MDIKDLVKGNSVEFDHFRQGVLYYNVIQRETVNVPMYDDYYTTQKITKHQFPVPIEDVGSGTMLAHDKAITYMRWIRKAVEDKTLIKI